MFEKDVLLVTHVTLLQHKFSSSLGIGRQTLHSHHCGPGLSFKGGSVAESTVVIFFLQSQGFLYPYSED